MSFILYGLLIDVMFVLYCIYYKIMYIIMKCCLLYKLPGVLVRSNISEKSSKQELPQFDVHLAASLAKDLLEHG